MTQSARRARIEAALAAVRDAPAQHAQEELMWNGAATIMPIVRLPLDCVLLNPRSHRIRAELEAVGDPESVADEPFGEAAQEEIARILRATAKFSDLQGDLERNGQLDWGVVTREGVLINANTRAVALRDLNADFIRLLVLPPDVDEDAIEELEAYLQMKRDLKQGYTFPNELLFIEDMKKRGKSDKELAQQLGYAKSNDDKDVRAGESEVRQRIRILAFLRNVQRMSGNKLSLKYFDSHRQSLIDMDAAYEATSKSDPSMAERIRTTQVLTLISGHGYEMVRNIKPQLLTEYLPKGLREHKSLTELVESTLEQPPDESPESVLYLIESVEEDSPEDAIDLTGITTALATSEGEVKVYIPGTDKFLDRETVVNQVRLTIESAVEEMKADKTHAESVAGPLALVREAVKKVRKARELTAKVASAPEFKPQELRSATEELERAVEALKKGIPVSGSNG